MNIYVRTPLDGCPGVRVALWKMTGYRLYEDNGCLKLKFLMTLIGEIFFQIAKSGHDFYVNICWKFSNISS